MKNSSNNLQKKYKNIPPFRMIISLFFRIFYIVRKDKEKFENFIL